jgi:hypothetical protein
MSCHSRWSKQHHGYNLHEVLLLAILVKDIKDRQSVKSCTKYTLLKGWKWFSSGRNEIPAWFCIQPWSVYVKAQILGDFNNHGSNATLYWRDGQWLTRMHIIPGWPECHSCSIHLFHFSCIFFYIFTYFDYIITNKTKRPEDKDNLASLSKLQPHHEPKTPISLALCL